MRPLNQSLLEILAAKINGLNALAKPLDQLAILPFKSIFDCTCDTVPVPQVLNKSIMNHYESIVTVPAADTIR